MSNEVTVCAIVVTFNRKLLLLDCLDSLRRQTKSINAICIIDNFSDDGTPEILFKNGYIDTIVLDIITEPVEINFFCKDYRTGEIIKVHYVRMNENTGGAGGFHAGVKRAYEKGYDWFWLMDDDGKPDGECLNNLYKYNFDYYFIAPLVINCNNHDELSFGLYEEKQKKIIKKMSDIDSLGNQDFIEGVANPFNGVLLSKKIVKNIGFPMKEFFIWGDETEYMLRVIKNNYQVITVISAIHFHPEQKKIIYKNKFGFGSVFYHSDPNRFYIFIRNYSFIDWNYQKTEWIKSFLKYSFYFIITKKMSLNNYLNYLKALSDGLNKNFRNKI